MNIELALQKVLGFGVKEFIEKAIEGGSNLAGHYQNKDGLGYPTWKYEEGYIYFRQTILGFGGDPMRYEWKVNVEVILLDPLAWQAVGKVEGWKQDTDVTEWKQGEEVLKPHHFREGKIIHLGEWIHNMHRFIDALAEQI